MSNESLTGALLNSRRYYDTGATRLYSFRQRQLLTFKQTILKYETEINQALYENLKKTPEEVWTTETGKREREWLEKIQFGTGSVNNAAWQFTNHYLPFGGIG